MRRLTLSEDRWTAPSKTALEAEEQDFCPEYHLQIMDSTGGIIAEVLAHTDAGTTQAHARLIASAPELLAACREIAALAEDQGRLNLLEIAGSARAAIAQATGQPDPTG